jgi:transcriptional regulator with XRE-family HTH domain
MKIQDKIKTLRTSKNWTQEKMADMLSMSTNGYANIERGETEITIQKIEQIAKLFEMNYLDLINMGEKQGFYFNGNNSTNYQIQADKDLAHALDKSRQENSFLKEKIKDLEEIIVLLKEKNK